MAITSNTRLADIRIDYNDDGQVQHTIKTELTTIKDGDDVISRKLSAVALTSEEFQAHFESVYADLLSQINLMRASINSKDGIIGELTKEVERLGG
jgi:hypothetical protein